MRMSYKAFGIAAAASLTVNLSFHPVRAGNNADNSPPADTAQIDACHIQPSSLFLAHTSKCELIEDTSSQYPLGPQDDESFLDVGYSYSKALGIYTPSAFFKLDVDGACLIEKYYLPGLQVSKHRDAQLASTRLKKLIDTVKLNPDSVYDAQQPIGNGCSANVSFHILDKHIPAIAKRLPALEKHLLG